MTANKIIVGLAILGYCKLPLCTQSGREYSEKWPYISLFLGKGIGVCPSTNIYYPEYPKAAYLTRKQVIDLAKKGNSSKRAAPSQPNSLQFLDDLSADDLAILGSFFGVLSDMFELLSLIKIKYSNQKGPINADLYDLMLLNEWNRRRQR